MTQQFLTNKDWLKYIQIISWFLVAFKRAITNNLLGYWILLSKESLWLKKKTWHARDNILASLMMIIKKMFIFLVDLIVIKFPAVKNTLLRRIHGLNCNQWFRQSTMYLLVLLTMNQSMSLEDKQRTNNITSQMQLMSIQLSSIHGKPFKL